MYPPICRGETHAGVVNDTEQFTPAQVLHPTER